MFREWALFVRKFVPPLLLLKNKSCRLYYYNYNLYYSSFELEREGKQMKNLKVGKKFLLAFGSIVVLFLVSVIFASVAIVGARSSYEEFYKSDYQATSKIYDIRVKLQAGLKCLSDAALTADPNETSQFVKLMEQYTSEIQSDLQWLYSNYNGDLTQLKEFQSQMEQNKSLTDQIINYVTQGTEQANLKAKEVLFEQYEPQVEQYTNILLSAFSAMDSASADRYNSSASTQTILFSAAIVIASVALIATIIISLKLSGDILNPVRKIEACMDEVNKGNLSAKVDYESGDEFGSMAKAMSNVTDGVKYMIEDIEHIVGQMAAGDFTVASQCQERYVGDYHRIFVAINKLKSSINDTLVTLGQSADQVASGSEQVSAGAQALSQGATQQASSVEELAASINEISNHINQNAQDASQAREKAEAIGSEASESNKRMQDMLAAMSDISNSSSEIGKIIKTIEDIAFQTNILALNAAIEAARAGAAGKGFAVVADEVRNLASKSAEASKNTAALIENSLQAVENGRRIADDTANSLEIVVDGINDANTMMASISKAASEQAEFVTQITQGIDQISSVVQTNSATAQESAAASQELSGQAQMLKDLADRFKLDGDSSAFSSGSSVQSDVSYSAMDSKDESMNVSYDSMGSSYDDKY